MNFLKRILLFPLSILMGADFACAGGKNVRASQMSSTPAANLYYFATLHGAAGTSNTSITPAASGSKVFTVASGLPLAASGSNIRVFSASDAASYVEGSFTYSGTTLTVTADNCGTNTTVAKTDWVVCPISQGSTTYATTGLAESSTGGGYTAGGKTCGTMTATGAAIDCPDVVWTQDGSGTAIGPVSYCAVWVNTTNSITGAQCVGVKDSSASPQTASGGGTMTQPISNLLTMS